MTDPTHEPDEPDEGAVERQRDQDPDAPGLGVVDDQDVDPPEPDEPG